MTLARNLVANGSPGSVCLTEQDSGGAMEWLQDNLMQNVSSGVPLSAVKLQELDWSNFKDGASRPALPQPPVEEKGQAQWDLLIGSDLIYSQAGVELLPRVLKEFARQWPSITMLYCHTLHRFDDFDLEFCRELRSQGLSYNVVAAAGADRKEDAGDELDPLADDCAGFLEELFPEKRIVVFHVLPNQHAGACLKWSSSLARTFSEAAEPEEAAPQPSQSRSDDSCDIVKVGRICIFLPVEGADRRELPSAHSAVVIRLQSLGPFGSGQHPTTALVLKAMQELDWGSIDKVCDYGCGSGVLGLSAIALGARQCLGVDNVPEALTAAYCNLQANLSGGSGLDSESRFQLHLPPGEMLDKDLDFYTRHGDWRHSTTLHGWTPMPVTEGHFDLVVANIVVGPLCHSASMIRKLLRTSGQVLLAGMREFQVKQIDEAYGQHFSLEVTDTLDGWALVRGRLRSSSPEEHRNPAQLMAAEQKASG
ncbi:prmA [Symbiodinium natans]|uniref:ETFB lysine methyltransferase n=1 Tax=Symbiodinium natans TaxID=878477 RepID=A0A812L3M2_9DINO|nr:prmA [Symbiodinium natans]